MDDLVFWCYKCQNHLFYDKFYYRKDGARSTPCKGCRSAYYLKKKDTIVFNKHLIDRQRLVDQIILPLKNQGCTDCGLVFIPEAMDFDHVRGEKSYSISTIPRLAVSDEDMIAILRKELALCEVRCVNCHHRKTISRYKTSARRDFLNEKYDSPTLNSKSILAYSTLTKKGCFECGINDLLVLEFDHITGAKVENVSKMLRKSKYSLADVRNEIQKCQVLCAVCHRSKTMNRARKIDTTEQVVTERKNLKVCACGSKKDSSAFECRPCYRQKKFDDSKYPSLQDIIIGVETFGWLPYAKTLGVSDNGLRKIALRLGADPLPVKNR